MKEFIKIDSSFWRSTISRETADTRILFQAMIALANRDGVLSESATTLSIFANISTEAAKAGLERLQRPDPDSRSTEHNGCRVLSIGDNLWRVVNYEKYIKPASERTEYQRNLMRKRRKEEQKSTTVHGGQQLAAAANVSTEVEVEVEREKEVDTKKPTLSKKKAKEPPEDFMEWYKLYPRKQAREDAIRAWNQVEAERPPLPEMVTALKRRIPGWREKILTGESNMIPMPGTYLRAHQWLDQPIGE